MVAAEAASDLASAWLDVDPSEVEIDIAINAPRAIVQLITDSNDATAEGEAALARGDKPRREAVRTLRDEG